MSVQVDTSELDAFAVHLGRASRRLVPEARLSMRRAGVNIKRQLREEMGASTHFKPVERAISFDEVQSFTSFGVEVGPEKGSPGSLANIAYFGGSRGGGTVPDPIGALRAEAPRFMEALSEIAGRLV